ncbi:FixH family protein [Aquimarina intermedia]|uniref:FixH protein n=1 Tax=Aquimarina intermedia TaxID=350814 RepID=A0A5S5C4M6_9FLAO|nr:FixH family protein [Aquimarina intermedia]TYP74267.1 FixH protein [Aquimarina intermedia]
MKINWGTAIVLAFIGFISFILFFVIRMNTNTAYQHDLVTEEYYKKELAFQEEITAQEKGNALTTNITIAKTVEGIVINFPADIQFKEITGIVTLYRPSNKKLDFEIPIKLVSPTLLIPNSELIDGRWNVDVNWTHQGTNYLFKQHITL